ncbi:hypothetical protein [Rhodopseudomonas telluris]|uniref:Uncharacterized protein n=1 Tax=Rhodopseudomonas telluris TaxID=644215 RepID=A0ABV6EWJ2_9BRAD
MNRSTILSIVTAALACTSALAEGADDPMGRMRACSLMETAQRVQCLEQAAQAIAPSPAPSVGWTVGLTTSPVDYSPVGTASVAARARAADVAAPALRLTIRCRGGRSELVIESVGAARIIQTTSYRIDGGPAVSVGPSSSADSAIARGGDAVRLVQSLPDSGNLSVQILSSGRVDEVTFPLDGFDAVRRRLASACRWPDALAKPKDR